MPPELSHSAPPPDSQHRGLVALLPAGARLEIDEEGAHFLPYQRPAAFAARVLAFLGQAAGRLSPARQDG